jgi:hypothetical protein
MFVVFFKAWFGIVLFGMANGFILLPVLLSLFGPVENDDNKLNQVNDEKTTLDHFSSQQTKTLEIRNEAEFNEHVQKGEQELAFDLSHIKGMANYQT